MRDDWEVKRLPIYDPRSEPLPVPEQVYNAEPVRVLCINAEWAAHIIPVLYRLTRSDAWEGTDEQKQRGIDQTEQIIAALSRFHDGSCPETPVIPIIPPESATEPQSICYAGIVIEGDGDMGQVVTEVKIENGYLKVYYGKCCVDEFRLDSAKTFAPDIEGNEPIEPGDPNVPVEDVEFPDGWSTAGYTACAKADRMASILVGAMTELADAAGATKLPQLAIQDVQSAYPGINWGQWQLLSTYSLVAALVAGFAGGSLVGEDVEPMLRCRLAAAYPEGAEGISADVYRSTWGTVYAGARDGCDDELNDVAIGRAYESLYRCIGENDAYKVTSFIFNDAADCSCPVAEVVPDWDWEMVFDFQNNGSSGWSFQSSGSGSGFFLGTGMCGSEESSQKSDMTVNGPAENPYDNGYGQISGTITSFEIDTFGVQHTNVYGTGIKLTTSGGASGAKTFFTDAQLNQSFAARKLLWEGSHAYQTSDNSGTFRLTLDSDLVIAAYSQKTIIRKMVIRGTGTPFGVTGLVA